MTQKKKQPDKIAQNNGANNDSAKEEESTHFCITCEKTGCGSGICHCEMSCPECKGKSFRSRCGGMFVRFVPMREVPDVAE